MMGMRSRFGLGIARDLKHNMNKLFMRYESSCSEKRLYLYFEETRESRPGLIGRDYTLKRFPIRCVNMSYLLSPSPPPSSSTNKSVQAQKPAATKRRPSSNMTDEFVPDLEEMRNVSVGTQWAGCFPYGPFLFGGSQSALDRSCSLKSNTKVKKKNNNYPVVKLLKKDGSEFLFLDGELPADHGELYSLMHCDASNPFVFQVLFDTNNNYSKSKWVPLEGPPLIVGDGRHRAIYSFLVCNNKLLLFWYPKKQGAYCFDVDQKGWSCAPPSWGRSIPFLDCELPLLVEHDHDHLLLFTYGPEYVQHAHTDRSVEVFLLSRQCDTFQSLNPTLQLPDVPDVPRNFWKNPYDPDSPWGPVEHQLVNLGGHKVCLVLHRFLHCRSGKGKGCIVLITFEYEINIQSLDIDYRLLTVRDLKYTGRQHKSFPCTVTSELAGAVVL